MALLLLRLSAQSFNQGDTGSFASSWPQLIADSYSAPLPAALEQQCKGKTGAASLSTVRLSSSSGAAAAQAACGSQSHCVVPPGVTLTMDGSLDVGALTVQGTLLWSDTSQSAAEQWLCAGFVAVETRGVFELDVTRGNAFIFIKDNGAAHPDLGVRSFGGSGVPGLPCLDAAGCGDGGPRVVVRGRALPRTWSLLSSPLPAGSAVMRLLHDPEAMGWRVGDRVMLAPTARRSSAGTADATYITAFAPDNGVVLAAPVRESYAADLSTAGAALSAEVIMLSRSVVLTGDDFRESSPCPSGANPGVPSCTLGLHTAMRHSGVMQMEYTRVEKCGQRGLLGKYCLHLHMLGACPACLFKGNAVEFGVQRGLIVHGTHLSTSSENVLADVRGAGIYLEDGNEWGNAVSYNVVICPWPRNSVKQGCTVPGTDNGAGADTDGNQAGLWALGSANHLIGNRLANAYNGFFIQAQFAFQGRGAAQGRLCLPAQPFGRIEGNTCHGSFRFGFYIGGPNFPRHTDESPATNGLVVDRSSCVPFDSATGSDRGMPTRVVRNVDWANAFVGTYNMGDVQFEDHVSVDNQEAIYWKETKSFADGCAAHVKGGTFVGGNMALPDGTAFIIEEAAFRGDLRFEANHHCGENGNTGALCSPTYIFHKVSWQVTSNRWLYFRPGNQFGGVFALSPPEAATGNPTGNIFPPGYVALASATFSYLLSVDGGASCATAASLGVPSRYDNGGNILCKRTLRSVKIWADNLGGASLRVELWQSGSLQSTLSMPFWRVAGKQGYAFVVAPGLDVEYRVSLDGGGAIPSTWVLEFSDPVIGNRWGEEKLKLTVRGRDCGDYVSSQHDRRYFWGGVSTNGAWAADQLLSVTWGRGACTTHPNEPPRSCDPGASVPTMPCTSCDAALAAEPRATCSNGVATAAFLGGVLGVSATPCLACGGPECSGPPPAPQVLLPPPPPAPRRMNPPPMPRPPAGAGAPAGACSSGVRASPVLVSGRNLFVDGQPVFLKAVAWNPYPVGSLGADSGPPPFADYVLQDAALMQAAGINAVRVYFAISDTSVLDTLWAHGIYVIMTVYYDSAFDSVSMAVDRVCAVGSHPAVILWNIFNEPNFVYRGGGGSYVADANQAIAALKAADPSRPVAISWGELPTASDFAAIPADVWSANVYRGPSFGSLFTDWAARSAKPFFISEYGADSFSAALNREDQETHAAEVGSMLRQLVSNAAVSGGACLGGVYFAFADECVRSLTPARIPLPARNGTR